MEGDKQASPRSSIGSDDSDLMDDDAYIPPEQNMLLTDVQETHLHNEIAMELGVEYLATHSGNVSWPVAGTMFNTNARLMIHLPVRRRDGSDYKSIIFLVDTGMGFSEPRAEGASHTFLCPKAMAAVLGGMGTKASYGLHINDAPPHPVWVSPSDSKFHDINVMGTDFLRFARLRVDADYENLRFYLR